MSRWARVRWVWLAGAVVLGLRLVVGLSLEAPSLFADELGYLGTGRWIAGEGTPALGQATLYHPFYPLLLAPFAALFDDPTSYFWAAMAINAVAGAGAAVLVGVVAGRVFGASPRQAGAAALVAGVYPGALLYEAQAWPESLLGLGVAALVLAFHRLGRSPDTAGALLVGGVAGLLFAAHPRMAAVVAVAGLGMLALVTTRRDASAGARLGLALVGITGLAVPVIATIGGAELADRELYEGREVSPSGVLSRLGDEGGITDALTRLLGQSWYLAVGTAGLVIVGVVVIARWWPLWGTVRDWWRGRADARAVAGWAAVTLLAAGLVTGAVFLIQAKRADHLIYGRYAEPFVPVVLGAGVVGLLQRRRWLATGVAVAAVGALGAGFAAAVDRDLLGRVLIRPNVPAIVAPAEAVDGIAEIGAVSLLGLAGVVALAVTHLAWRPLAVVLVTAAFAASSWWVWDPGGLADRDDEVLTARPFAERMAEIVDGRVVGYDERRLLPKAFFGYQWWEPGIRFDPFLSDGAYRGPGAYVLGKWAWPGREASDAVVVDCDRAFDQVLFAVTPETRATAPVEPPEWCRRGP